MGQPEVAFTLVQTRSRPFPPSATISVLKSLSPPEEFLDTPLKEESNIPLEDRVIDGTGYAGVAHLTDGSTAHYNKWFGALEPDSPVIVIDELSGNEDEDVLDELVDITDTITWPEGTTWAFDKWRDQPW